MAAPSTPEMLEGVAASGGPGSAPVGIVPMRAASGQEVSRPGTTASVESQWGATDILSVREDWSSCGDLSPQKSRAILAEDDSCSMSIEVEGLSCGSVRSISQGYQQGVRSTRRTGTLTSVVSPRGKRGLDGIRGATSLRYGVHSIQNTRKEMEDAHRAVLGKEGWSPSSISDSVEAPLGNLSYFAIFDGHGGARAAEFSGERLCGILAASREALLADPVEALRVAFTQTEGEWLALALTEELMDGTTAAVALVDRAGQRCIVGNVGDSEILLGTRDVDGQTGFRTLTEVHHLKRNASEAARIADIGGRTWKGRLGHPKINPQVLSLSVSRAIGDVFFKDDSYTGGTPSGLIAEPYINSLEVCTEDVIQQFLVVACDGLWDTVTYEQASDFVFARLGIEEPEAISEGLVNLAAQAGSSDNITVLVVVLCNET